MRNTDSFFKDDSVETKKISLTPNLLRDEVNNTGSPTEAKEVRPHCISPSFGPCADIHFQPKGRGSMEAIDKALSAYDKTKDDKKRKDKKPGMLSGLFKRKDKKTRTAEDDGEEAEKTSSELSRTSPQPKTSSESVSSPESRAPKPLAVQRQSSKLQKQPPAVASPTKQDFQQDSAAQGPADSVKGAPLMEKTKADQTIRQVAPDDDPPQSPVSKPFQPDIRSLSSPTSSSSPVKRPSPTQVGTNDVAESPIESYGGRQETMHSVTSPPQRFPPTQNMGYADRRMESPGAVSPLEVQVSPNAPGLTTDLSSPGGHSFSPVSPPLSPTANHRGSKSIDAPSSPAFETMSVGTPTWSDASLRSYLDDDNDIRDLFYIVHDNSNVPPAGPDHPITGSLFKDESKRLKEMSAQLDSLLSEWVGRRGQVSTRK